jgi:hypothetical protein
MDRRKIFGMVWGIMCLVGIFINGAECQQLVIEKDMSDWQIVISGNASISEKYSASELQKFLKEISGAELPVGTDGMPFTRHEIILGDNLHLRKLGVKIEFEKLGDEGFTIRTVGDHMIIAGGRLRGTMYGVYTFLQDYVGCRWFTPPMTPIDGGRGGIFPSEVNYIPKQDRIEIGEIDDTQVPKLEYRAPSPWANGEWCSRNKTNNSEALSGERGGFWSFSGGHTFFRFVPPKKYFKEHPEYYSEIDGKRTAEQSQLCLTNPDVLRITIESLKQWMREDPSLDGYHVSQMDWGRWCQCANCRAIDEREGTPMGSILTFVNKVAEGIEKEFPAKFVVTFAYDWTTEQGGRYSQKPPKTIKPRKNVIVMLPPILACFSHPIEECERNRNLKEDIEGWSRLLGPDTGKLYIHGYTANAGHGLLPHPNFGVLQKNIQFYVEHGVKGIYDGSFNPSHMPEIQLRSYILAKLHWDPYCDVDKAMNEYLTAYYGKAGPYILQYIDLLGEKVRKDNIHCGIHTNPTAQDRTTPNSSPASAYLTPEIIKKVEALFDKAEKVVIDEPMLLFRVQTARLGAIDYFKICTMSPDDPERDKLIDRFFDVSKKAGIFYLGEGRPIDDAYKASLRMTLTPESLAKMGENLLKNGGFEAWNSGEKEAPDGWEAGGAGVMVFQEKNLIKEDKYSAGLSVATRGPVSLNQRIPVGELAGKTVVFGAWVKSNLANIILIYDQVGDEAYEYKYGKEHPGDGNWHFLITEKEIREGATGKIMFGLNHYPGSPEDVAYFDGVIAVEKKGSE